MRVPFINFGRWSTSGGKLFFRERIYISGYRWTPFVWVEKRYSGWLDFWRGGGRCSKLDKLFLNILGKEIKNE